MMFVLVLGGDSIKWLVIVSRQCGWDELLQWSGSVKGHQLPTSHPDTVTTFMSESRLTMAFKLILSKQTPKSAIVT